MILLSIGCCACARWTHGHLNALHQKHALATILDARDGITASAVFEWAKHQNMVERIPWGGDEIGAVRVRTVLDNAPVESRVIVWGAVPAFVNRERRRYLDVPMGLVIQAVLEAGFSGWAAAGDRLVAIEPLTPA